MRNDVAVIGMSCKLPGATTPYEFWQTICKGEDCITRQGIQDVPLPGSDHALRSVCARGIVNGIHTFDYELFGLSQNDAAALDPQHRLFLEAVLEALETSGNLPDLVEGCISLYCSAAPGSVGGKLTQQRAIPSEWLKDYTSNHPEFLATRIGYLLNLTGECLSVLTACSSSLVAIHLAVQSLLLHNCDLAIAGGVSIKVPQFTGYVYQPGMIYSQSGYCRPFDQDADGTVEGNGLGVVILKRLDDALRAKDTIYAVLKGTAINNDGHRRAGYTAPGIWGQQQVIERALAAASLAPTGIGYIEAHGTGTPVGDPIEVEALKAVYGTLPRQRTRCAIGSLKANIGHLGHAAGVVGFIKAVLCLYHKMVPPQGNFKVLHPSISFADTPFFINRELQAWTSSDQPRRVAVSSFGIGGTNAHAILEEAPAYTPPHLTNEQPVVLSASTPSRLQTLRDNLREELTRTDKWNLTNIAFTLNTTRKQEKHRFGVVVHSVEELISALDTQEITPTSRYCALLDAFLQGEQVDFTPLYTDISCQKVPLRTTPFERVQLEEEEQTNQISVPELAEPALNKDQKLMPTPASIKQVVEEVFKEMFKLDEIDWEATFVNLGGDSMDAVDFFLTVESRFDSLELPVERANALSTLRDFADFCIEQV